MSEKQMGELSITNNDKERRLKNVRTAIIIDYCSGIQQRDIFETVFGKLNEPDDGRD